MLALGIAIFDPYRSSLPGLSVPLLAAAFLANLHVVKAVYFKRQPELLARKRALGRFEKLVHVVILMCAAFLVRMACELGASYFQHAASILSDPLPLNAMEGRETVKAWLLAQGRNIYPSMQSHPFLVTIYPPVYHAAIAAMSALTGWGIAAGRLVSLGSFLAIAMVAGWWTFTATRSRLAAAAIVLVTLYDPVLAEWSLHARPDMLAWMLALAGAWTFWAAFRGERLSDRLALAAGVLLCLACFTKQQALPYLLGCAVWGLGKGRAGLRPVLVMGACAAALGAALAGALELSSGGNFLRDVALYPKLMGALPGVSTIDNLITRLMQVWSRYAVLWSLFAAYLGWAVWNRRWDLPAVLAVVNAGFMVKLLASWGADVNYAFGAVLAALLAVGLLLGAVARSRPYGLAALFALLFLWLPNPSGHAEKKAADLSGLTGLSGSILVNTEGGHLFLNETPGRAVTFFDGIETQLYEQAGLWRADESELVQDIRDRRFDRLVFYGNFLPPGVSDSATIFYEMTGNQNHYMVFKPASAGLIAALAPSGRNHVSGQGRAAQSGLATLHAETEGLAPLDRKRPGLLRFRLEGDRPLGAVQATLSLRVDPKDPGSSARYALLDAEGRTLADSVAPRGGRSDVALKADVSGNAVELLVELSGNAWLESKNGMLAVVRASY
ncbi:MAG: hypothetical protein FD177_2806 [Desulfovibrionaceae bacterium]|nr:MAG: hypothetical protein FD177_2806 [Desulfovibrionaceae bacterium]